MDSKKLGEKTEELYHQMQHLKAQIHDDRRVLREMQQKIAQLIRDIRANESKLVRMEGQMSGLNDARWIS